MFAVSYDTFYPRIPLYTILHRSIRYSKLKMTINGFALACALDDSPPYFTYEGSTMLIIQSKSHAKSKINAFEHIEPFIVALISHESIHVIIKKLLQDQTVSDSLDDLEIIVERNRMRFQVTLNNMFFANDMSGIVFP